MRIYDEFPEITNIKAKILKKQSKNNISQVILDKTIFMPENNVLLNDSALIDGKKVLSVREKNNDIIVAFDGTTSKSIVELEINKKIRRKNLSYNTAFILFSMIFKRFYGKNKLTLCLNDKYSYISIDNFTGDLDKDLFEKFINYAIFSGLKIKKDENLVVIDALGKVENNYICFDNTYKIISFTIE